MNSLFRNIRFYILTFNFFLGLGFYFWVRSVFADEQLQIIRLTQIYALTALSYLYLALLATPFCATFKNFIWKAQYLKARRAIGVSTFFFALIHASLAFFGQLGGFPGLWFLTSNYLLAISLSFISLLILSAMAATSFDYVIAKMTFKKWKKLHRLIYIAALFILIHGLMLGTHFTDLSTLIPRIFFVAFSFLAFLEGYRFDGFLQTKFSSLPKFGIMIVLLILGLTYIYPSFVNSNINSSDFSIGIHSQHIKQAQESQNLNSSPPPNNIPGLQGDRALRFNVDFDHTPYITFGQEVKLLFQIYNSSSGTPVFLFNQLYTKPMHLIIVDDELNFFNHIHPEQDVNGFKITTVFPKNGTYHLYIDFQPTGAIEQQFAFPLNVGSLQDNSKGAHLSTHTKEANQNLVKDLEKYKVELKLPEELKASEMSLGKQKMTFKISDSVGNPITNLKSYLGAFGHLVMINHETFDYIHVHPVKILTNQDEIGGPEVEFMPIGLLSPIKPGIYRVFAQFNPNGELITTDFTVKIE